MSTSRRKPATTLEHAGSAPGGRSPADPWFMALAVESGTEPVRASDDAPGNLRLWFVNATDGTLTMRLRSLAFLDMPSGPCQLGDLKPSWSTPYEVGAKQAVVVRDGLRSASDLNVYYTAEITGLSVPDGSGVTEVGFQVSIDLDGSKAQPLPVLNREGYAYLWHHSFGDPREMTAFASSLPPGVYVTQLTPWGISLAAPDRRELGCIDGDGRGRVYVYLVLPYGFGARAARKRDVGALSWFDANHAEAWMEQGFTEASSEGPVPLGSGTHRRWAVRLVLRFVAGDGAAGVLAWAAEWGVIEFGAHEPRRCTRRMTLWSIVV